ncbi:hypothetical protein DFH28DRAFT_963050 [Melampsora americana]|nr:hypothetical protein DFH28DRAFT_963050 [Melampsora americana]
MFSNCIMIPISLFLALVQAAIAQGLNIHCDKVESYQKGRIDQDDCERALEQFRYQNDWMMDDPLLMEQSCSTCQITFELRQGNSITTSHDAMKRAVKEILDHCQSHAGSMAIHNTRGGKYGNREMFIINVRTGLGGDCNIQTSWHHQWTFPPHGDP